MKRALDRLRTLAFTLILLVPGPSIAFTIIDWPNVLAGQIHQTITIRALVGYVLSHNGREVGTFSTNAIKDVVRANRDADLFLSDNKIIHFDDEYLSESLAYIEDIRDEILMILGEDDPYERAEEARRRLGLVLHTMQDFYSHTNWVDNLNSDIVGFYNLRDDLQEFFARDRFSIGPACEDGVRPISGSRLSSGYHPDLPVEPLIRDVKCLHGDIKDFRCERGGLNKDRACWGIRHSDALRLATLESEAFVGSLVTALRDDVGVASACALLDIEINDCPSIYYADEIVIEDAMNYTYDFVTADGTRIRGQSEAPVLVRFTEVSLDLRKTPVILSSNFFRNIGPDIYFGDWVDPNTSHRVELFWLSDVLEGSVGGIGDQWTWRLTLDEGGETISGTATNTIDVPNATGGRNRDTYSKNVTLRLPES